MSKRTKLNENANIYQQREELTERQKLKGMTFKQKVGYLWEYYKLHGLAILCAIGLIVYIIVDIVTPDIIPQLNVAIINNPLQQEALNIMQDDMFHLLHLDPEKESIQLDPSYTFLGSADYSMNMRTVFLTKVIAKEIDIVICPKSEFANYTYNGFMHRLSEYLPTDLYSSLTDSFYVDVQENDPTETVYGIYVNGSEFFNGIEDQEDPYILGIISNTTHIENSIEFVRYLFQ